ncbi:MAG: hypothetical protein AAF808_06795 [Cyanobacteria bacterium P01_D01_bin.2]
MDIQTYNHLEVYFQTLAATFENMPGAEALSDFAAMRELIDHVSKDVTVTESDLIMLFRLRTIISDFACYQDARRGICWEDPGGKFGAFMEARAAVARMQSENPLMTINEALVRYNRKPRALA